MTDYTTARDEMRLLWSGHKNWIERAERKEFKHTPEEAVRKKQILASLAIVGAELNFIADHTEAFKAWKVARIQSR